METTNTIYFCTTYYHTLITIIKALQSKEKFDVILCKSIPEYQSLKVKLDQTGLFGSIYFYDTTAFLNKRKQSKFRSIIEKLFLVRRKCIATVAEKYLPVDVLKYTNVYVYMDNHPFAYYLIYYKKNFHLIEDALDFFKYYVDYYHVNEKDYTPGTIRYLKRKLFGYFVWGNSPFVIDIEVNDLDGIKIPKDKVKVVPRKDLFSKLSEGEKLIIYNTYVRGELTYNEKRGKTAVIFTQPLLKDKFVKDENEQLKVFECIAHDWFDKGYNLILKPHPRDEIDYTSIIKKYHIAFIDKNLPSEILNFNPNFHFEVAVAITTTAINFLDYADEKIFLGWEYMNNILENK